MDTIGRWWDVRLWQLLWAETATENYTERRLCTRPDTMNSELRRVVVHMHLALIEWLMVSATKLTWRRRPAPQCPCSPACRLPVVGARLYSPRDVGRSLQGATDKWRPSRVNWMSLRANFLIELSTTSGRASTIWLEGRDWSKWISSWLTAWTASQERGEASADKRTSQHRQPAPTPSQPQCRLHAWSLGRYAFQASWLDTHTGWSKKRGTSVLILTFANV